MFNNGILFPLGILFIAFGGYEAFKHGGIDEHSGILLAMGILNTLYTLSKVRKKAKAKAGIQETK